MSAVYSPDCACWLVDAGCAMPGLTVERHATERAACLGFEAHKERFEHNDSHRHWLVHGPGGHVAAVRP